MSDSDSAARLATALAREFRALMLAEYIPRIRRCVSLLSEAQCWRKQSLHGNSIANLLMHLEGNVRQWILCGLGAQLDQRHRPGEFATGPECGLATAELLNRLEATTAAACDVVDRLLPGDLLSERVFQSQFRSSGLGAVLHVLEHFSGHAGQIYAWTKQLTQVDLKFYDL